ncbi:MAG: NCS2 family permease [Alphaproteobacteria bacterium]|nr:NCS2 family permease [Alphaproteobacteria bacterium]
MIERIFGVEAAGSTVGRELRAGLTTFVTMAYILFVNPVILSGAIDVEGAFPQLLTATALAAAVGSLMMGLVARHPFALAPGMGLNAYFAAVVAGGVPWQTALGAVCLSGLAFVALSLVGARTAVLEAIPRDLRLATGAGIGAFLAFVGAQQAGWVVDAPHTLVSLGDLTSTPALLAALGLALTGALAARRVPGAILLGVAGVTAAAVLTGAPVYQGEPFGGFAGGPIQAPVWPTDLWLQLDLGDAAALGLAAVVFTFAFVDLFDTAGTLVGLAERAGFTAPDGSLPRSGRAFLADAVATVTGALLGTSTTTTYIESAAGIEAGGRTGLTAVTVGLLFLASLVCWPLAGAIPAVATGPVLVLVGAWMMQGVGGIAWDEPHRALPAFLTILGMPLTFSIADGLSAGLVAWVGLHALTGRAREVSPVLWALAVLLVVRIAWVGG